MALSQGVFRPLEGHRQLDRERLEILKRCQRDLLLVSLAFHDDDRKYFLRLCTMTSLVLDKISSPEG